MNNMMEPKIRFKGFEGEWRKAKLGDIATFSKGSGYSKSDLCKEGLPIVLYGRLYTKYQSIIDEIDTFVAPKANSVISTGGEVIIPASGESPEDISLAATIKNAGVIIGGDLNVLKFDCNNNNPDFMSMAITYSPTRSELSNYSQGKTVVHLRNSEIAKGNVCFPRIEEQKAIANYVLSLDSQISASTSRLASLKQMKAASLQAMFPQEGETVPKIRFKGFEGEWKKVKADSIFKTFNEKNRPDLPVLSATQDRGMVTRESIGYNIFHDTSNEATYKHILPGQFVIHLRSFQGGFAHSEIEGIASPAYTIMDFKNKDLYYDYYWRYVFMSKEFIKRLELITYGIRDGRSISYDEFKEMSFLVPSKEEQIKIASYLRNLDRQISLQSQRLEKLKQIKSACLDKMFV